MRMTLSNWQKGGNVGRGELKNFLTDGGFAKALLKKRLEGFLRADSLGSSFHRKLERLVFTVAFNGKFHAASVTGSW